MIVMDKMEIIWHVRKVVVQFRSIRQGNEFEINGLKIGAMPPYCEKQTKMSKGCKTVNDV